MAIRRSSIVSKPHVRSSICAARGGGRRALPVVQCFHLGLFLLLFAGRPVSAGPNEGGTLIVHRDPSLIYTAEQDYCGQSISVTARMRSFPPQPIRSRSWSSTFWRPFRLIPALV